MPGLKITTLTRLHNPPRAGPRSPSRPAYHAGLMVIDRDSTPADLAVVGAGTAGLAAALAAAEAGASVLLLEAARDIGGTLHLSHGQLSAAGTRLQAARGIADSPDAHFDDVMRQQFGMVPDEPNVAVIDTRGVVHGVRSGHVDPALFEDLPVFWGVRERRPEFPRFYAQLLPFRRAHAALRRGSTTWVRNADEDRIVTFVRQDAAEEILVAVNLSNRPFHGTVEVGGTSYVDVTPWREGRPGADAAEGQAPAALPALTLEAWGVRLFRRAR